MNASRFLFPASLNRVWLVALAILLFACSGQPEPEATPTPDTPTQPPTAAVVDTPIPTDTVPPPSPTVTATTAPTTEPTPSPTPTPTTPPRPEATGKGVTIVILDRGIDWRHPDFRHDDGTTRVRWILDMSGQTNWCAPGRPQPVEYSADDINAALTTGEPLAHRDAVGHGTATAGMAAGNGRALPDGRYAGIAPEADLIIVKVTSEGAPAHGDAPEEAPFNACIDEALDWVDQKIDELGQPAVALWNAGTQWGPIDGTSATSRKISQVFGPDRPGRVWVASSGDEGSLPNHAGGEYSAAAAGEVSFDKVSSGSGFLTAWYSGDAPAQITLTFADGTAVGPVGPGVLLEAEGVTIVQYRPGEEFYPWQSTGGDRAVWIRIDGHEGGGAFRIEATGQGAGRFDVYGDVLGPGFLTPSIEFLDNLVDGRLNDVSATIGAIVVGDHVAQESYVDINGILRDFSDEGVTGDLWLKSSGDPTRDGRNVLDVTAAGQNAFAALSQDSYWSTLPVVIPQSGEGWYIRFGGTSASGPIVVGAVALMLEVNPDLTAAEVKEILRETAVSDEFTGPTPNLDWGYGKLDLLAAVQAAAER